MSDPLAPILARYRGYNPNADFDPDIASLEYLPFESTVDAVPSDARLVLVLVEPRLLEEIVDAYWPGPPGPPAPPVAALLERLERFKGDLAAAGFRSRFVAAQVYAGRRHQDGRTLLSIRRFFRDVRGAYARFAGAVLVGSFPEATIVRRWIWRLQTTDLPMRTATGTSGTFGPADYLRIVPESVADRSELVLADLDGGWEELYRPDTGPVDWIEMIPDAAAGGDWPLDGQVLTSSRFNLFPQSFADVFWVQDDAYTRVPSAPGTLSLRVAARQRHPELTAADRARPNPTARPDIAVSRINALHVAVTPDRQTVGDDGQGFLGGDGRPRIVPSRAALTLGADFLQRDAGFERRVLLDYFDRNHAWRAGAFAALPFRTAAITSEAFSASDVSGKLSRASAAFAPPVVQERATLLDYVRWHAQPAVLKGLLAHSSAWNSAFGPRGENGPANYSVPALEAAAGGPAWRWYRDEAGGRYVPGFAEQGCLADLYVHRTLWENGALREAGASIVVHGGCQVNTAGGGVELRYNDPRYGELQNAEGLLFFTNAVAVVSRAKVFNDFPDALAGALAVPGATVGDAWRAFFEDGTARADLAAFGQAAVAKETYSWSVIGDWTARIGNAGGLGVVTCDVTRANAARTAAVHPNGAWIGGWNFDAAADQVAAVADVDGDGRDEVVLTSAWGIGVVGHNGARWRSLLVAARETPFGAWRWNASAYGGTDRVQGAADLDGDGRAELVVTSRWGIGVLALTGAGDATTLRTTCAHASGTALGGWTYDAGATKVSVLADVDGDGRSEIVVTSGWGIGVLGQTGPALQSRFLAANGTRLGGWVFDAAANRIAGAADLTGDGRADLVVTSDWGIGVLSFVGGALTSAALAPSGADFGGWRYDARADRVVGLGDVNGDGRAELIVLNDARGLAVLALDGGRLRAVAVHANAARLGGWAFDARANVVQGVADFDGDGRAEVLVSSAWGRGMLGWRDGALRSLWLAPYGTRVGDWSLDAWDRVAGVGRLGGGRQAGVVLQRMR